MHGTPYEVLRQREMNLLENPVAECMVISTLSDPWFSGFLTGDFFLIFNPCSRHTGSYDISLSFMEISLLHHGFNIDGSIHACW